ncbi:hypothetical protein [Paenibacillus silvae]|uniref:Uncharacterized protein n=1 Tax=Paenibacillus silvae TaxID=1325358 RepID=A0A2W6NNK4_9BACL|nr:hypothetical protein [Paenibacillus silvae]PZT57439.1 hypothetical protein DN757_01940 [Paenibacillus silvae]
MKLFYAHHQNYSEDWGVYAVENADELMQLLADEEEKSVDYIRQNYIYGEMSQYINVKSGKKFKVTLEEV